MNIDIYIQLLKDHHNNSLDAEECEGIAQWLEELKKYRDNARELKKTIDSSPCLKEILQKFQEYGEKRS